MSRFPNLFEPLVVRGRRFPNRLLSTGHAPGYAESGLPGERYQAYHEEKAKGGIGLTIFGGSSNVSRTSGSIYGQIFVGDDRCVAPFRAFAARVRRHGAGIMCQITHMGRRTSWASGDWLPTMGPSALRDPAHRSVPYAMSTRDIDAVRDDFAAAARRCREGDLDGVEILATTHLLGQFLSPLSNKRDDAYGGSLENRARFLLETVEACRAALGEDRVLGVRFAADEANEGGMASEEGVELARMLGAQGAADFLNVNGAYGGTDMGVAETFPGMAFRSAPYVELARRVKEASGLLVFQAARLSDPATAEWAIGANMVDMAGLTRPHMADPHIGKKLMAGEEARIRPCVGAGYCIDRVYGGGDALCLHNVSTGREGALPHAIEPAPAQKRVAIVGGGPAGLEAARVAAERGHVVTLFEAAPRLGGQLLLAQRASWRKDMIGVVQWLEAEVERLGVRVELERFIEGDELLDAGPDSGPDIVIVATGGVPAIALEEGGDALCLSTWDALEGGAALEGAVMLYDEGGGHGAISTADHLAANGADILFATTDAQPARAIGGQNRPVYMRNLERCGAAFMPEWRLIGARKSGNRIEARLRHVHARNETTRLVDHLIVDQATTPADAPYHALLERSSNQGALDVDALLAGRPQPVDAKGARGGGSFALYRVGDAVAARDLHAAMLDAHRLARTL